MRRSKVGVTSRSVYPHFTYSSFKKAAQKEHRTEIENHRTVQLHPVFFGLNEVAVDGETAPYTLGDHGASSTWAAARNPDRIAAWTVPQCPVTSVCSPEKKSVSATGAAICPEAAKPPFAT